VEVDSETENSNSEGSYSPDEEELSLDAGVRSQEKDGDPQLSQASPKKKKKKRKRGMGMHTRKLWTPHEDKAIYELVDRYGTKQWTLIAKKLKEEFRIKSRTGKQVRERYHNYLDPGLKRDPITEEEEKLIFELHKKVGSKWAEIVQHLPGRPENTIKNHFYSNLKRLTKQVTKALQSQYKAICSEFHLNLLKPNLNSEALYGYIMSKRVSYERLRRICPKTLGADLEGTMRLIYDHEKPYEVQQKEEEEKQKW